MYILIKRTVHRIIINGFMTIFKKSERLAVLIIHKYIRNCNSILCIA